MSLHPSNHGQRVAITYNNSSRGAIEVQAFVSYNAANGAYYLVHDEDTLGGTTDQRISMFGKRLAINISSDIRRAFEYIPGCIRVDLIKEPNIYVLRGGSHGMLFRAIHKIEEGMIFMGPTQKDIEECKKPSSLITIHSVEYIKQKGWKMYEGEKSAEERAKSTTKPGE